ncbi:hypothetical protein BWQ96_09768 [Gracilariopsis chorda]|uniref:Uncharacterized protein n=1 Tax=Gracilariopsis chorda TaxID=448386 RepID=A0A2V3IBI5_9FLOR|nr:hypothetical protein BWQ96_10842 [Gracilariopsis chorda]PXF40515.1 hypothetical protein BWQ96_09768 [Gracilariopsis chorda]|eukprot:PXF39469.1 hypothetical protein BWQ96_10842 [Gracilariopsis chorda]
MQTTGIKCKPLIARVLSELAHAFPYDTMHLCFSGLVSMMIRLTFGMHENLCPNSCFVIPDYEVLQIKSSLSAWVSGFPTDWGRYLHSFEKYSSHNVETMKVFALYYAIPILSK